MVTAKNQSTISRWVLISSLVLLSAVSLTAQTVAPVAVKASFNPRQIEAGAKGNLVVTCTIDSEFHISDASSGLFEVSVKELQGLTFNKPDYPKGHKDPSAGYTYSGTIDVAVPFKVDKDASAGSKTVKVTVYYQPCAETGGICYPPDQVDAEANVLILSAGEGTDQDGGFAGKVSSALEKGSFLSFLLVFLGGILTSLTPCVYPMIPITMAVIGAQATGGKLKGFILSLFYVMGIAVTFTTLGVIAAKTGAMFGSFSQHPVVLAVIGVIFFMMGLSLLGVFVIQMPASIATKLRGKKKKGFLGALITGALAGLVVSPCISPLLVVILAWVAKSGSVLMGAGLLLSYSLGLGILFILIGTFSGVLKNMPKSGTWMEIIERGFGVLLVMLAIIFVKPVFSPAVYLLIWSFMLIVFGTFIGAFTPLDSVSNAKKKIGKALGIITVLSGSILLYLGLTQVIRPVTHSQLTVPTPEIENHEDGWLTSADEAFTRAKAEGKPVVMDFFAQWCNACKELDHKTWPNGDVQEALKTVIPLKLDLTKNNADTRALQEKYQIIGMPTVILFDPSGTELDRFEGFQPAGYVVKFLNQSM